MLMVYEAAERMEPIRFVDDRAEIDAFREKYNAVFESLRDRWLVEGGIDNYCELWLSQKGVQVLKEYSANASKKDEVKWKRNTFIIAVISAIIAILSFLLK